MGPVENTRLRTDRDPTAVETLIPPHTNGRPTSEVVNGKTVRPRLRVEAPPPDWQSYLPTRASSVRWRLGQRIKRVVDFVGASIGLIVIAPLLAILAVVVKLSSRGPILYASHYIGERGKDFVGYKFRSMVDNAADLKDEMAHLNHMKGPAFKIRHDPRVTPVGRFLRKFSLDELPQLWSVVRGDMSLVGPRPPLPEEYDRFSDWHRGKLAMKPGITCYWQINGRSEISDFEEWVRLDRKYIEDWSLWTDCRILLKTIPVVFHGHGAY